MEMVIRNGHFGLARPHPVAILTHFPGERGGAAMAFRAICVALLLSSLSLTGCGTVANLARSDPEEGGRSPFGGVRQDAWCFKKAANGELGFRTHAKSESEEYPQVALMLFCAVDLPLSLIGDIVTWPYTASYSVINQPIPTPPVVFATPPVAQPIPTPPLTKPMPIPTSPATQAPIRPVPSYPTATQTQHVQPATQAPAETRPVPPQAETVSKPVWYGVGSHD
jgi:uncharacterized protein YceK